MQLRLRTLSWLLLLAGAVAALRPALNAEPADHVFVESSQTSIYVGRVTLTLSEFARQGDRYSATYKARVFPYFFMNEHGNIEIHFSAADLDRLRRGESVEFKGDAENSNHEPRRIEGRAVPSPTEKLHGKIKVRVFVTNKIQLIFNTTYRFSGG